MSDYDGTQPLEAWLDDNASERRALGGEAESGHDEDSCPTQPRIRAANHRRSTGVVTRDGVPDYESGSGLPAPAPHEDYRHAIARVCNELRDFLLKKNESYGNSAFEPSGIFSKLEAREGILLRIDDKLKRIRNGCAYPGDNDVKDLTGYLILLMVLDEVSSS